MPYIPNEYWINCGTCDEKIYRSDAVRNKLTHSLCCRTCYEEPTKTQKVITGDPRPVPGKYQHQDPDLAHLNYVPAYAPHWEDITVNWETITTNWEDT